MRGKKCTKIKIKEYACEFYYRKVPKAKTLVIFGFVTLQISLLSEAQYFRMAKTCPPNGHFKNLIAKNVKGNEPNNLTTISEITK